MSAVDAVLSFKRSPDEDFYGMLNCDENSSVEQIQAEYKVLALQYHPDKNDGDKDAEAKFQRLKEAKETLCDPEKRANYDKWRNSGIAMSYKNWLGMKEHVGQSMHWATPKTKDRMLPEAGATTGAGGSGGLSAASPNPAHRRASEGGAALYYGNRKTEWGTENSDVANKFRNYEI
ncbi:PREDICTED: J domain-containing protein isoform X2 [Bactrocera latifrons]|uniref:J domain-containing protein n=1 Tax=Bactrocera latifrons TaxID=174628 RepID=A0A0K8UJK9_BACLA|nr:PREDICTED: J domain-containing protein isoform X2 [Bactrocera latifrons]